MATPVLGMFISDLHFTEDPPPFRSNEVNWIDTQEGYIEQLCKLQKELHDPPLFIAGDVFDKWNPFPHIINHALKWMNTLTKVYGIPGNHDLPNHNYKEIQRSAYWTLVESAMIENLTPGTDYTIDKIIVTPFPHGFNVGPPQVKHSLCPNIALIHSFIWVKDYGYVNASEDSRYAAWTKKLEGYDAAFFGDNHKNFLIASSKNPKDPRCKVLNTGTFMKRRSDEKHLKPCVGLLHEDRIITRHYLDISKDIYLDIDEAIDSLSSTLQADLAEFTSELDKIHGERLDFAKTVLLWCDTKQVPANIKSLLLRCLGVKN